MDKESIDLIGKMVVFGSNIGIDKHMILPQITDNWVDQSQKLIRERPSFNKLISMNIIVDSFNYCPIVDKDKHFKCHVFLIYCIPMK